MTNDNDLDLPTVLEECAEHIRAGRDPRDYFEVNAWCNDLNNEAGWVTPRSANHLVNMAESHHVRRKHPTITINGVEVAKPDGAFAVEHGHEITSFGETTTATIELHFNRIVQGDAIQAITEALRGEQ